MLRIIQNKPLHWLTWNQYGFCLVGREGKRQGSMHGQRDENTCTYVNALQRSSNTSHSHIHIISHSHDINSMTYVHHTLHANYLTIKIWHGAEASVKQYMFFMICLICPVCIRPVCRDTPGQKAIVPASRPGRRDNFLVSRRNPSPSSFLFYPRYKMFMLFYYPS